MGGNLFELALTQIKPSDWQLFEKLASMFLSVEYESLRTMASPEGDKGRDSELFCPDGDPLVCMQYSVSVDWATKIRNTHNRLKKTFPKVQFLVYATNQTIGARGDELKTTLLKEGRFIDIRDMNWFLERQRNHPTREAAAEELINRIAIPFVREYDERKNASSPLSSAEARTALTYISLQWHDDQHDKGLTKICFDALVRAALRQSSSENPVARVKIHQNVLSSLPSADSVTVVPLVDSSLNRLKRKVLTHNAKSDTFFLDFSESKRIQSRIADTAVLYAKFKSFLGTLCIEFLSELKEANPKDVEDLQDRIPRIIETLCLSSGEHFVSAVNSGRVDGIQPDHLNTAVINDLAKYPYKSPSVARYPELIQHVIRAVTTSDDEVIRAYLRNVFASYTLLAFLNQTPDVQKATKRIFSHGKIWIDTSVLLPLFAEQLFDEDHSRVYQTIFEACLRENDELFVVKGVLGEIHHHIQLCFTFLRERAVWQGNVPYLLARYLESGRPVSAFREWIENFRGDSDPLADIELYLKKEHGIEVRSLIEDSQKVDDSIRMAVDRLWTNAHETRRRKGNSKIEPSVFDYLKANDVEMFLGVMGLRLDDPASELGARSWLLTNDKIAWNIRETLRTEFPEAETRSPLLSTSFLINAIAFSPSRANLNRAIEIRLPTILDVEFDEGASANLLQIAEEARASHSGLPERLVRRKVRDTMNLSRLKMWQQSNAKDLGDE